MSSNTTTLAKLADESYKVKPKSNIEGWILIPELSNDDTKVYQRGQEFVISSRGTSLNKNRLSKDISQDLSVALNTKDHNKLFKSRRANIKSIIKTIKKDDPNSSVSLTGHSLGGSVSIFAMNDKFINKNVEKVTTFNGGSSPLGSGFTGDASKIENNVVSGDFISQHALPGKTVFWDNNNQESISDKLINAVIGAGISQNIAKGVVRNHGLSNFTKGNLTRRTQTNNIIDTEDTLQELIDLGRTIQTGQAAGKLESAGAKIVKVGETLGSIRKTAKTGKTIVKVGRTVSKVGKASKLTGKLTGKAIPGLGEALIAADALLELGGLFSRGDIGRKQFQEIIDADAKRGDEFLVNQFNSTEPLLRSQMIQFFGGFLKESARKVKEGDDGSEEYKQAVFILANPSIAWSTTSDFVENDISTASKIAQGASPLVTLIPFVESRVDVEFKNYLKKNTLKSLRSHKPGETTQAEVDAEQASFRERDRKIAEDNQRLETERISQLRIDKNLLNIDNSEEYLRNHPLQQYEKNILNIGIDNTRRLAKRREGLVRAGLIDAPGTRIL